MANNWDRPIVGTMTFDEVLARRRPVTCSCNGCKDSRELRDKFLDPHYARGVSIAGEMGFVTLSASNCWGGRSKDGGSVSAYECIGYHTGADRMLLGVLESGCPVYAYGDDGWRQVCL